MGKLKPRLLLFFSFSRGRVHMRVGISNKRNDDAWSSYPAKDKYIYIYIYKIKKKKKINT
jgi:hypothetical protein